VAQRVRPLKARREKLRYLDPVLVSIPEFARMSGLGDSFVRRLVKDDELPARVIGSRKWIIRAEAVEWLHPQIKPRKPRSAA
jgi:predicted DNA-binding transcriptional regulator AlpA